MTPPSAKAHAAKIVEAMFGAPRKVRRRCLDASEVGALVAGAYDAGVLAQQRFTETPKG